MTPVLGLAGFADHAGGGLALHRVRNGRWIRGTLKSSSGLDALRDRRRDLLGLAAHTDGSIATDDDQRGEAEPAPTLDHPWRRG
jgi:hypothetical protein